MIKIRSITWLDDFSANVERASDIMPIIAEIMSIITVTILTADTTINETYAVNDAINDAMLKCLLGVYELQVFLFIIRDESMLTSLLQCHNE